jgi:hypothetical protein
MAHTPTARRDKTVAPTHANGGPAGEAELAQAVWFQHGAADGFAILDLNLQTPATPSWSVAICDDDGRSAAFPKSISGAVCKMSTVLAEAARSWKRIVRSRAHAPLHTRQ